MNSMSGTPLRRPKPAEADPRIYQAATRQEQDRVIRSLAADAKSGLETIWRDGAHAVQGGTRRPALG